MDDLIKAIRCYTIWHTNMCAMPCEECEYYQSQYDCLYAIEHAADKFVSLEKKIKALEKSNRTWRRKCQRLRHELKEVRKSDIS